MGKRLHVKYYILSPVTPYKRNTEKVFVSPPYENIDEIRGFIADAAQYIDQDLRDGRCGVYRIGHVRVFSAVQSIIYQEHRFLKGSVICQSDCDESLDCGVEIWVEKVPGPIKKFFINMFRKLNS
ncbi:hypothetical protein 2050H1_190 [Serratia phage 2050H1]|uniref:Uncharacterized protein n=1 Tax=Serratia phage 2050H1 TaxID=2024250 RepID=A0A249Y2R3_9CAUD|nr:hypothetical protein 2050H1_190 [Serratia phage 2050H1]